MIDLMRKSVYAALGLAVMTREKVEESARKIASDAKMSEAEGKKFVDELVKKSEETKASIEKMVNERVDSALKKVNICTQEELKSLEKRVSKLENDCESRDKK
ncbi:phasin family protein [Chitinispirillales bacterium ANBcel5]|uniref:phasin family protein n=1 Tax=Cellulosispirillum alkaliphilum TaxID=3039283 RepID=UPI002A513C2F|nr:phasin family protein [Chitinispirillales bacterium ANBcel5]